jgi:hypothetical protein
MLLEPNFIQTQLASLQARNSVPDALPARLIQNKRLPIPISVGDGKKKKKESAASRKKKQRSEKGKERALELAARTEERVRGREENKVRLPVVVTCWVGADEMGRPREKRPRRLGSDYVDVSRTVHVQLQCTIIDNWRIKNQRSQRFACERVN